MLWLGMALLGVCATVLCLPLLKPVRPWRRTTTASKEALKQTSILETNALLEALSDIETARLAGKLDEQACQEETARLQAAYIQALETLPPAAKPNTKPKSKSKTKPASQP